MCPRRRPAARMEVVTTDPNTTSARAPAPSTGEVAVAVVTGPDGVLAGRRRDGTPLWVLPGGRIEAGETPAQAAVRECAEETGVIVTVRSEIGQRVHPVTRQLIVYLSCVVTGDGEPWVAAPNELAEVRWLAGPRGGRAVRAGARPSRPSQGVTGPRPCRVPRHVPRTTVARCEIRRPTMPT